MSLNLGVPEYTSTPQAKKACVSVPNMWIVGVPCLIEKQINLLKDCNVVVSRGEGGHLKVT